MPLELFTMCSFISSIHKRRHGKKRKSQNGKLKIAIETELLFNGFNPNWNERKTNYSSTVVFAVNLSMGRDGIDFPMICNKNPLKFSTIFCTGLVYLFNTTRVRGRRKQKSYRSKAPVVIICSNLHQWSGWSKTATQCNMMQSLYDSLF